MPDRNLGQALTNDFQAGAGTARIHEGGLVASAPGVTLTAWFNLPPIARPTILSGEPASRPAFSIDVDAEGDGWTVAELPGIVDAALAGRVGLTPLGGGDTATLSVGAAQGGIGESTRLPVFASALAERVLHDVTVRTDSGATVPVAPHAVYYRRAWSDFGLAHITDMHVARRIDLFRGLLREARRPLAAAAMVNWNDRFRGFVKYANYLHGLGALDVIVATGDLFDYIHEEDDDPDGGGNALFLRELLLGQAPGPEFPDVEPLRVPVFMVPGNHDYRRHPYRLIFDLHVGVAGVGKDMARVKNFSGLGLRQGDATALANRLDPGWLAELTGDPALSDGRVPNLSSSAAARMVATDPGIAAYHRHLNDTGTYVAELGDHRILMVDSGPDVGVVDSILEAIEEYVGLAGEDEATFLGGSPNCKGPSAADVDVLATLLENAAEGALVMVATHAPYVNLWQTEYPYFLRETQRRHHGDLVEGHLDELGPGPAGMGDPKALHPSWFGPGGSHEVDFVKRGDTDDLLDFGVSRGETGRLLRVITGIEASRPADLVLAGHTHRDNEVVIRRTPDGASAFFFDFYTDNPGLDYPTASEQETPIARCMGHGRAGRRRRRTPDEGVRCGSRVRGQGAAQPRHLGRYGRSGGLVGHPSPAAAADGRARTDLRAARLRRIPAGRGEDNVVRQVYRVPIDRLDEHGYVLEWEAARAPLQARRVPSPPWLRVSEGSTAPSGRVTAVPLGLNEVLLVRRRRGRRRLRQPWQSRQVGSVDQCLRGRNHSGRRSHRGCARGRGPALRCRRRRWRLHRSQRRLRLGAVEQRVGGQHPSWCGRHRDRARRRHPAVPG